MDKYNGSSNAFFFGLAQGVQKFVQSEGGGPGSPEMSFLYELGINEFVQNVTNLLRDPNDHLDYNGVFAGYMDDLYWAATFDKMVEVIKFVLERGPAYGYNLNMKKSVYLMAPTAMKLSAHEIKRKIQILNELGVPTQNIKVHPGCQLDVSIALADERRAEWGIKILGAYVGSDEYVVNALRCKMVSIRELTQIMLYYPNAQARYYLHRFCYNAKINYWMRAQFPKHVAPFVDDFKEQQQKLIASYHEIHDGKEFNHDRRHFDDLYQREALPIEKDGMALNNVVFVSLTAFACSIAASMKELAKVFPDWIKIGSDGKLVNVVCHKSPDVTDQIVDFANEYRLLAPQGPFKEGDDLLDVMKSIESIDVRRGATTAQGVLYSHLIEAETNRLLEMVKRKANETRDHTSYAKVKWRNWFSLMNSDSGAWLTAGLSPKLFVMSNDEFISAVCRRNTVQDPRVPKHTSALSRESYDLFQCGCDGGAQPKAIDPFGYHFVGCKIGANAIRLHDQVVVLIARLFRSLRLEAIVEPIRLFAEASPNSENQRPDILIRNPRGFGRSIILDVAISGIDGQSRPTEESPDRHLQARYDQNIAKYGHLADRSGFQLIPAVFSHTGQIHAAFKDLIREQIRQKIVAFENQAKPSKIKSVLKWWSKCISMVIAKTASRNVVYKANKLGESMFARQSEMLMPEEELGSQSPVSYEEDFEDLSSNADLYVFNDQMAQGYRGVNININTRDDEESVGEMHMKDYIDVSNQENVAPVYFQSLSLD